MGVSVISYAEWTKFGAGYVAGAPIPQGDCLEMLCDYSCVEDESGNGYCCSAGNKDEKCYGGLCCKEGLMCSSTTGEGTCLCHTNDTVPENVCYDTVNHPAENNCPAYTAYPTKPCTCSEGYQTDCSGGEYSDTETLLDGTKCYKCITCPDSLPAEGEECTLSCGCASIEGLECNSSTGRCECTSSYDYWNSRNGKCCRLPENIYPPDRSPSVSPSDGFSGGPYDCDVNMTVSWSKVSFSFHVKVNGERPSGSADGLGSYKNGYTIRIPAGKKWTVMLFSDWPFINATGILPHYSNLQIKFSRPK